MCPHQTRVVGSECPGHGWVKRASPPGPVPPCLAEWALPCLRLRCLAYKMGKMTCILKAIKINECGSTSSLVIGSSYSRGQYCGQAQPNAIQGTVYTEGQNHWNIPLRAQPLGTRTPVSESVMAASSGGGRLPHAGGDTWKSHHPLAPAAARDAVSHSGKQTEFGLGIFSGKHLTMDSGGE